MRKEGPYLPIEFENNQNMYVLYLIDNEKIIGFIHSQKRQDKRIKYISIDYIEVHNE